MRIKPLLLLFTFVCLSIGLQAQRTCSSHELLQEQLQDPDNAARHQAMERQIQDFVDNYQPNPLGRVVITLPIVFHIVHNGDGVGSGENISDAQIMAQLDQLNLDYSATNSDIGNVPAEFQGDVANPEIQFCLATTDPDGNPTTGIIRHQFGSASWTMNSFDSQVKPSTIWDRDCYLNFWTARFGGADDGLLGYAQFPNTGSANTDGVVQLYSSVGSVAQPFPGGAPFNLGRTATHEIGHWLGLFHIWGDDGGGCGGSDSVADTPNQGNSYGGCPTHPSASCGSNDMFMNYMDYVSDACMFMFSNGQKARMVATLNGFRSGVRATCACVTPTCTDGVQNGNETGVDCGGPDCPACPPSCTDGILNGNETDIDCGGPDCPVCPTCTDGTQNGDETGVDCGGSDCPACPDSCGSASPISCGQTINGNTTGGLNSYNTYLPDGYTGWNGPEAVYTFTAPANGSYTIDLAYPGGTSTADLDMFLFDVCDPTQNYLNVSFNAPNTAEQITATLTGGTTYYIIIDGDATGAGAFELSLTCPNTGPTCTDGILNGNETGIDCGGPDCPACPTCTDGILNGNETGVDCGGPDCPACPDSCGSASPISCGQTINGNTTGGTNSYNTYLPDGYTGWNGPEAVYTFTAPTAGTYTIDLAYPGGTSTADLDLFLFDVCDPTQNYLAVSFNAPNTAEQISTNLSPGTYYIIIDGDGTGAGAFDLTLTCPAAPSTCTDGILNGNETGVDCGGPDCPACPVSCDTPNPISCGQTINGNTTGGLNSYNTYLPDGYTGWNGPEAVYTFTAPANGSYTIDLAYPGTSTADLDIFLFDVCDPTQNYLAVSFNAPNIAEQITATLTGGTTYYIIVDGDNTDAGPFDLTLTCPVPPTVLLTPKVFLQGPLSGTTMNTALYAGGMLPTTSPYTDAKTLTGSVPTTAVDWVYVEIRSDNTAAPATVVGQSGILLDDSTIVDEDGTPLEFAVTPGQSWYVVIKHRNHLGVMTATPVTLN